jgi:hypothetical protein
MKKIKNQTDSNRLDVRGQPSHFDIVAIARENVKKFIGLISDLLKCVLIVVGQSILSGNNHGS